MSRAVSPKSLERLRDPAAPLAPRSPLQHTQTDTQREDLRTWNAGTITGQVTSHEPVLALDLVQGLGVGYSSARESPSSAGSAHGQSRGSRGGGGLGQVPGRVVGRRRPAALGRPRVESAVRIRGRLRRDKKRRDKTRQFRPREGGRGKGQGERARAGARTRTSWLFSSMSTSLSSMASSRRPDLSRSLLWRWRLSLLRRKGQVKRRACMGGEDQRIQDRVQQ